MSIDPKKLADNLARIHDRMAAACGRVRRDVSEVALVAVTKSVEPDVIRELVLLGQTDLGESRVQQLAERAADPAIAAAAAEIGQTVRWHMVGHLQRNKVKACLDASRMIHSVDSLRLAEEINARAAQASTTVECLLEVNTSSEPQKDGVAVGAATHMAEQIRTLKCLRLTGLMTMAPLTENLDDARRCFVRLRELFEEIRAEGIAGREFGRLSMGMSNDFEAAIEEGATLVRVGTALFEDDSL
ncbi:MAG: YggS family pyridoxal phosphate-dependent enzyme [Planctomycetes bacterium]|nr:YggS family pyridoxal phosphate-dependent enzyme [Planctomycetota bacterium]